MKGHRSDILVENEQGIYFELNFINIDRLKVDFLSNKEKGKNYFTYIGLIVIVNKDSIVKAIHSLIEEKYFLNQKPIKKVFSKDWFVITLNKKQHVIISLA